MAAREDPHGAHGTVDVIKVNADGEGTEICVRPELDVLMPFHFFAAVGPLVVELRMVISRWAAQEGAGKF